MFFFLKYEFFINNINKISKFKQLLKQIFIMKKITAKFYFAKICLFILSLIYFICQSQLDLIKGGIRNETICLIKPQLNG